MANRQDVTLTFSPNTFLSGLKKISKGFGDFTKNVASKGGAMGKNIFSAVKPVRKEAEKIQDTAKDIEKGSFKALVKFELLKQAIVSSFNFLKSQVNEFIPEVGQTFSIVRQIISKNLLFPIRKELMPLLQKILTWTRENRGLFVKWGGVLANVFRFVTKTIKVVFSLVKSFTAGFSKNIENIFGLTTKTLSDTLNVFLFKMSSALIFLEGVLKPGFEGLGEIFGVLINSVQSFSKGFINGFSEVFDFAESGSGVMDDFVEVLGLFKDIMKDLMPIITVFGKIFGKVFGLMLKKALIGIKVLLKGVKALFDLIKNPGDFKEIFSDFGGEFIKEVTTLFSADANVGKSIFGDITGLFGGKKDETAVDDGIIRPDGKVIKTNPKDTLVAVKNIGTSIAGLSSKQGQDGSRATPIEVNLNVGGLTVQASSGDAQSVGEGVILGMKERLRSVIREIMIDDLVLQGGTP